MRRERSPRGSRREEGSAIEPDIGGPTCGDFHESPTDGVRPHLLDHRFIRRDPAAVAAYTGGFPSGQRGQTVNLMATPSQVRILSPPPVLPPFGAVRRPRRPGAEAELATRWGGPEAGVVQW